MVICIYVTHLLFSGILPFCICKYLHFLLSNTGVCILLRLLKLLCDYHIGSQPNGVACKYKDILCGRHTAGLLSTFVVDYSPK